MKKFRMLILVSLTLTIIFAIAGCDKLSDGHSHRFIETERVPATCSTDGKLKLTCSCGEEKTQILPKTEEHDFSEKVEEVEPTCEKDGHTTFACTVCGERVTETMNAKGHNEMSYRIVEPTCTKSGYYGGAYCEDCGKELSERTRIPATNDHTIYSYGGIPATCTTPGYEGSQYCTTCKMVIREGYEVPPTGIHTEVVDKGYPATCGVAGLTNGRHCSVCGTVTSEQKTIPALVHNYEYEVTKQPEYMVEGEIKYTCNNCGDIYTEAIPALTYQPEDVWNGTRADGFAYGEGTEESPYVIETAEQLAYFASQVNNGNSYYKQYVCLKKDIIINDLSNYYDWEANPPANMWTPIGHVDRGTGFCGNFDGNGYSIRGIYSVGTEAGGLFGKVDNGVIENVNVTEAYIYSTGNVAGGIVCQVDASDTSITIESCIFEGTVISPVHAGGIVGYARCGWYGFQSVSNRVDHYGYLTVSECRVDGTIKMSGYEVDSSRSFGGAIGHVIYTCGGIRISHVYNEADVISNGYAGGIVGRIVSEDSYSGSFYAYISYCTNDGDVSGAAYTGGIAGYVTVRADVHGYSNNYCKVLYCTNYGNITKTSAEEYSVGGIAGALRCASQNNEATLQGCFNKGTITVAEAAYEAGGIAGGVGFGAMNSTVSSCHNTGSVITSNTNYVGGLFGKTTADGYICQIDSCYNTGDVFANEIGYVGGISGYTEKTNYTNVYNTGDVNGVVDVGGIFGGMGGGLLEACYNTGIIYGNGTHIGAIVGILDDSATVQYAYYLSNCAHDGEDNRQGAFGRESFGTGNYTGSLTQESMILRSSFSGFDFSYKWTCDGYSYPTLQESVAEAH